MVTSTSFKQDIDTLVLLNDGKQVLSVMPDTLKNSVSNSMSDTLTKSLSRDTILQIQAADTLALQNIHGRIPKAQDTVVINFHNVKVLKQSTDTIGLFRSNNDFSSTDSVQLLSPQTLEEVVSIREKGIVIFHISRTENGVITFLLVCFFLLAFLLARSKRFLLQQFKDFITHRERVSIFFTSRVIDIRYSLLLILQTCIFVGFCMFYYFERKLSELAEHFSFLSLTGVYTCMCLAYLIFKWIAYSCLGQVFFDRTKVKLWMESYLILIYSLGFVLFPIILLLVYLDLSIVYIVIVGFLLMIIIKLLMFYKWIKLFSINVYGLLLLFLYFCAIEIIPLFLFYEGLAQLNNALVINS
ncbi:hypothetical protein EZS27_027479 [termite gut metagenome]|uniref:DUF4271 domain-containing protein n=1 Tax=termite gut metagenome TaxID=433724 RepID=A0A5J4QM86_9ZZZZ